MSGIEESTVVTEAKLIKYRYNWEIRNYMFYKWSKPELPSPSFVVPDYGNDRWHIKVASVPKKAQSNQQESYISFQLILDTNPRDMLLRLTLAVITSVEQRALKKSSMTNLKKVNGFEKFTTRSEWSGMTYDLPIDTITLRCDIELMTNIETFPSITNGARFNIPKCDISSDVGLLFNDETTADITLTVGDRKFHAHRLILMARSSVFAAMFRTHMKESITKNVDIENLDADIFEEILRFIYTDHVPDLENKAIDILDGADKYDLKKLKVICEKSLYNNVKVENAAEILVMADRHRAHQLKARVHYFIKSHMQEVINTEGYKNMELHHPKLTIEALKAMAIM